MEIDKNLHYFCLMRPHQCIFDICFTSSTDDYQWYECEIDERRYKVADNYKITLRNINGPEYEHYYQCDFEQLIESGCIIPKVSDKMHIEEVNFREYIPGTIAYIQHSGQCIVEA